MRISKGRVRLDGRDVRVGNFVYTDEDGYVKLQDISRTVVQRISKDTAKGRLLSLMLSAPEESAKFLEAYAAVSYNFLGVVVDPRLLVEVNAATVACLNRHGDVYGMKDDVTAEEDAAVLREERELRDAMEDIAERAGGKED